MIDLIPYIYILIIVPLLVYVGCTLIKSQKYKHFEIILLLTFVFILLLQIISLINVSDNVSNNKELIYKHYGYVLVLYGIFILLLSCVKIYYANLKIK